MKKLLIIGIIAISNAAQADDNYSLFNPVPADKLRPMTSERPSRTDSPFTIDSGHLEIETSLFNQIDDRDSGVQSRDNIIGQGTNFRLGLTQSTDIQLIIDPHHDVTVKDYNSGTKTKASGFGDTVIRVEHNLWGNDGGDTALAVTPYIKFPTNQDNLANKAIEGGVVVPFNYNLPDNYSLGLMTQLGILKDNGDSDYNPAFTNTAVLSKNLTDKLSVYGELAAYRATDTGSRWEDTVDFGVVYSVTNNFHIDTGANFGITKAADDANWFLGMAYRF